MTMNEVPHDAEPKKRPASQYYWGDWHRDLALQSCPLSARGLWHEMNCLMHQGEPYGHLTMPNGKPMTLVQLATLSKISERECKKLVQQLDDAGVLSKTPEGVIYSRRMVRDEAARNARAVGGKAGAEHGAKGAEHGKKGGRPKKSEGGFETPLTEGSEPPPSSSSSSSPSEIPSEPDGSDAAASTRPPEPQRVKVTDPDEIIFGYGVPLLTGAGSTDKHARSFLAGLRKAHGDGALIDALRACIREKPLRPLEWLAKALPPPAVTGKLNRQEALEADNHRVSREWAAEQGA